MSKHDASASPCERCDAACCRYVATEIDTPTGKRDYDHIRWYLLHHGVSVFIDHEDRWFLEFDAVCEQLQPSNRCGIYDERPRICQQHGDDDGVDCEFMSDDEPHAERFASVAEFDQYLDDNGINWRWKKSAAERDRKKRKQR